MTFDPPLTYDWQLQVRPGRLRFLCVDSSSWINKVFTMDNSVMMGDIIRKVAFKIVVRSLVVGVYRASRLETPLQNRQ